MSTRTYGHRYRGHVSFLEEDDFQENQTSISHTLDLMKPAWWDIPLVTQLKIFGKATLSVIYSYDYNVKS